MSVQAMAWALKNDAIRTPICRFVLLCLANYAGVDGRNAYPSIATLSRDTGCDPRTVRRALRALERAAVIELGNQLVATVGIRRADRRPTVYDLAMPREGTAPARPTNGRALVRERGGTRPANPLLNRKASLQREASFSFGSDACFSYSDCPLSDGDPF